MLSEIAPKRAARGDDLSVPCTCGHHVAAHSTDQALEGRQIEIFNVVAMKSVPKTPVASGPF
jgi:hypothetical protein